MKSVLEHEWIGKKATVPSEYFSPKEIDDTSIDQTLIGKMHELGYNTQNLISELNDGAFSESAICYKILYNTKPKLTKPKDNVKISLPVLLPSKSSLVTASTPNFSKSFQFHFSPASQKGSTISLNKSFTRLAVQNGSTNSLLNSPLVPQENLTSRRSSFTLGIKKSLSTKSLIANVW